ncbi:hypothetical protein V1525DRAFT_338482 [Lipomyces kononenkoae]|uniref:Uncharacterized protein n=1 Tax=Lipomyces kononenkoae TaxID=34357 RepID=A0ACC3T8C7_LIPKO
MPEKRKRTVMSCTECHRRKQKCDRQYPCRNCIKRGKQNLCHFDAEPKGCQPTPITSNRCGASETSGSANAVHKCPFTKPGSEWACEIQDQIRDFGYSSHSSHNSINLLQNIEHGDQDASLAPRSDSDQKYKELVRQLPTQACMDILIQTFFSDINWQYDLLDAKHFREQLEGWSRISYSDLQASFRILGPKTLVFPALLFQVLAQALLFHSPHDKRISALLTMTGMTFHDLGAEYSVTGAEILTLLGKRDMTITTVQAGLLRASFLKSNGKVVEAWHSLGATIRDAQEIGLHTGQAVCEQSLIPERDKQGISAVGHKIWVVLHVWDVHMAVVLGRPIATDLQIDRFARTIDDHETRRQLFSHWQTETDPPRPFDIILAGYNVAYQYFQEIHQLELNGAKAQDYAIVERIHAAVKKNLELLPSWCYLENPNTMFDQTCGCQWLPAARESLSSLIHLVLLALHRPYIFSVAKSRTEALTAGIAILRAQERLVQQSEPHQCKVFNPVYASFDAIVLIAAIYIAFPNHDSERRAECVQVVETGVHRLGFIGQFNRMAKSAHGVASSLCHRLKQRLDITEIAETVGTNSSSSERISPKSHRDPFNETPLDLSFDAVLPPHPTHDLFYDRVSSTQVPVVDTLDDLLLDYQSMSTTGGWNFEGNFSDTSFWSLMNDVGQLNVPSELHSI